MYKELGFTKEAGIKAIFDVGKKAFKSGFGFINDPSRVKKVGDTARNVIREGSKTWETFAGAVGITTQKAATKAQRAAERAARLAKAKKTVKSSKFLLGAGAGVVGGTAINSISNNKKRNSPYYPY